MLLAKSAINRLREATALKRLVLPAGAVSVAVMSAMLVVGIVLPASAQQSSSANAKKFYAQGLAATKASNHRKAIASFSQAINSGSLAPKQMAQALFLRGIAYRHSRKPAQAISDFNNALYLKGGLSGADRAEAIEQRLQAFGDAGVSQKTVAANRRPLRFNATPRPIETDRAQTTPTALGWQTKTAPTRVARAPARGVVPATTRRARSTTEQAAPSFAPQPTSAPSTGNAITGFFQNLFQGGARPVEPNASPQRTASVVTPPRARPDVSRGATAARTSGWVSQSQSQTQRGTGAGSRGPIQLPPRRAVPATPRNTQSAAAAALRAPAAPAVRSPSRQRAPVLRSTRSGYDVQVAVMRDKFRAEALAKQIDVEYSATMSGRKARVEQRAVGNMGTFYIVRIGAYDSKNDVKGLCGELQARGLDCLVQPR